jgi:hypothetical protein
VNTIKTPFAELLKAYFAEQQKMPMKTGQKTKASTLTDSTSPPGDMILLRILLRLG